MKVEIKLEPEILETCVEIHTKEISQEITDLMKKLQNNIENRIVAWLNEKVYILEAKEIESIYSNQGKVYIRKDSIEYITKNKLYELEEKINEKSFIRISNSEIINFDKVENLDLSINGTIQIKFKSGYITYASRRNIKKIKEYLKI